MIPKLTWRRVVALALPLMLLVFAIGFIAGLEVQRGPNWRLELNQYLAQHTADSEIVTVEAVLRARRPDRFQAAMAIRESGDWIKPSSPPQAVRCVLLLRRPSGGSPDGESVRQVVFLVLHSDALYRVGWLAYEGPEEPFGQEVLADLASIGCDLGLE